MKANFKSSVDNNRQNLFDIVPTNTPFTVYLEPTRICNFKCFYCMHSNKEEFSNLGYDMKNIPEETFEKIVNDLAEFPQKIKRVNFSGLGEPMANRKLPQMIKRLREKDVAERIDIISNAALLDNEFADELISAGVSKILISIQGLNDEEYFENAGVKVDFNKLVSNITYFYENKKENQELYIKIIDVMIKDDDYKQKFFDTFGNICDNIFIEHLIVLEQQMEDKLKSIADNSKNLMNEEVEYWKSCSVPFYHLDMNLDGDIFPCPAPGLPKSFAIANIHDESLLNIWNGAKRQGFLKAQLKVGVKQINWCKDCVNYMCVSSEKECLDNHVDEILKRMENKNGI